MSAVIVGVITFVCLLGGIIVGLLLRRTLPEHHFTDESKDVVKMGAGLIATLSALVLALLLSSAKNSFDEMNLGITQGGAKLIMLDRTMASYGMETQSIRQMLRGSIVMLVTTIWPEHATGVDELGAFEKSPPTMEIVAGKLRELTPRDDWQRTCQSEAIQLCKEMLQIRWLMFEKAQNTLPPVFLGVLLFWLTLFFASIGLLAPPNKTVLTVLVICVVSVSSVIFLIEEMNNPIRGIVKISSAPLIKAVETMGK